jgi:hypothetical protein
MKYFVPLSLLLLLISCGGPKINIYKEITPKIDIKEAITIASEYLDTTCGKDKYIKDSVRVWEWARDINIWNVSFKKTNWQSIKPPTILVGINKETGKAEILGQE